MKKITLFSTALLLGIFAFIVFYYNFFVGLRPAIISPKSDIAEIIEKSDIAAQNNTDFPLALPKNFSISIFAKDLGKPRVIAWGPTGEFLASLIDSGKVIALKDSNGDGYAETSWTVADGLNKPHGIAVRCRDKCELYIAEENQLSVFDWDSENRRAINKRKVTDFPTGGNHATRTIMFRPYPYEDELLISIGSSCNVCIESDPLRASIQVFNVKTNESRIFATGLRNSVFMSAHPVSGEVWATEMGRDWLGNDLPPDEINIIKDSVGPSTSSGRNSIPNFGWPICYGKNIHDSEYDKNIYVRDPCADKEPSLFDIPAHSAPLGLAFFPEEGWPEEYWYDLLVAYHGSWNSTEPVGYKLVRYDLDAEGKLLGVSDFISGWLQDDGSSLGRPVDILIQPAGTIYVSDDKAGVIYKIQRETDKSNLIRVFDIEQYSKIESPLIVSGEARGYWFFEASFPVRVIDSDEKELGVGIAQAKSEWMTQDFVPFEVTIEFVKPETEIGWIVLEKDNPSGLPENADELRVPVRFR
ncbi:TPA: hypothetical protein DCZ32_01410 [Candidatus Uhrbacteria bacterium]|nr:hypothetical protein [Candidatus Uhrbacteria bacterium]